MRKLLFTSLILGATLVFGQQKRIDSIAVYGLKKSKTTYIQKLIFTSKNDPLDTLKINEDLIRLIREPAVSHAYYSLDTLANEQVKLNYHIEENKTLIPAVDVWSTLEGAVAYHIGVNDHNFLGRGYKAGAFYRRNNRTRFGVLFSNPNFIDYTLGWEGILQKRNTLEPVKKKGETYYYDYTFWHAELGVFYRPRIEQRFQVNLGFLQDQYVLERGEATASIPMEFDTHKFLLKSTFDFNQLEQHYYFQFGVRNRISNTWVLGENFGGERLFYALENETTYFKRIGNYGNWASRLQLGISRNFETPFPAFFIDNNLNVRGIGNRVQRGSALAAWSTEYRHTLLEQRWLAVQANGFLDIAAIRPAGSSISTTFDNQNTKAFGGIGIRIIHKFIHSAILRIDYGFSLKKPNQRGLVFGIGQFF
jgi:outer membrane protein assembly factor BamA